MKKYSKIMIAIVCLLIGTISIKAETFDYTLGQYRLQYHMGNSNVWRDPINFNTSTDTTAYDYIKAFAVRLGNSNKFVGMREYTVAIEVGYSPIGNAINNAYTVPTSFSCGGSTSLTSWSADYSKVDSCEFIGATRVGNTNHIKYIYKIKMTQDIVGIQININLYENPPYGINGFNVYKNTTITYGEDITGAIDNQTIIIENAINNIETNITNAIENSVEDILGQDHTYTRTNPADQPQRENDYWTEEITDYFDDLQTGFEYHITIPTGAAEFIWNIINRITGIEIIRTLIISILCLGLVKMVLNR